MSRSAPFVLLCLWLLTPSPAIAGMPAPLPTYWTVETPDIRHPPPTTNAILRRWQGISFFGMALLVSGAVFRWMWNGLRRDVPQLPTLSIRTAYTMTFLWGIVAILVLTMISGARELMTPGAWKKQGWTYALNDPPAEPKPPDRVRERREAIERLKSWAWDYAARHAGRLPDAATLQSASPLSMPVGVPYLLQQGRSVDDRPALYAVEPVLDGPLRFALRTNGDIAELSSAEIAASLASAVTGGENQPASHPQEVSHD